MQHFHQRAHYREQYQEIELRKGMNIQHSPDSENMTELVIPRDHMVTNNDEQFLLFDSENKR